MPLVCTCGTSLPDDARFCYRCGKPQREADQEFISRAEAVPIPVPPPLPPSSSPQSVSFSNPLALRTSLLVASITTLLEVLPLIQIIAPLLGGYISASLYQRRSGHGLSAGAGAKLGWLTAVLNAVFITIFMTVNFAMLGSALFDPLRENIRHQESNPMQGEVLRMLNDPHYLALIVLFIWLFFFGFSSVLSMLGGALGARMYRPKVS